MPVAHGSPRDRQYRAAIEYEQSVWQNRQLNLLFVAPLPKIQGSLPDYIDTRTLTARRYVALNSQSGQSWEPYTLLQGWPNQAQSVLPAIPQFGRDIREERGRYLSLNSEPEVWQNLLSTLLFEEPVVEAPFSQADWPLPSAHAVRKSHAAVQPHPAQGALVPLAGWDDLIGQAVPAIAKYGRDIALQRAQRAAVESQPGVWQDRLDILLFSESVPFAQMDWPVPNGYAVARRAAQAQVATRAETEVLQDTPLVLLTTPPPPVLSTMPDYLAATYRANYGRHISLRAPPEVIGSFPTIILTTPGFNLTPGVVVAPAFLAVNYRRNAQLNALRAQVSGDPQTWLTTPPPPDGKQEEPADVRDRTRAGRYAATRFLEQGQNENPILALPDGRATYPDRLPRAPYRQYQVEGDPQTWLTTPPPPEGRSVQPDALTRIRRAQPELTQNLLNSVLAVTADTLPEGQSEYPDRLSRVTRLQPLNGLGGVIIGEEVVLGGHIPSLPKFGRDIAESRRAQVALRSEFEVWQNPLTTTLAPVDIPVGRTVAPDRFIPAKARQYLVQGDPQTWLTTAGQPDGKREFPAAIRGRRRVQPDVVQVSRDLLAGVVAGIPDGDQSFPAAVRGRKLHVAVTSQPVGNMPGRIFVVPLTLRLVINSNPSDAPEIDTNPTDPARVGS